jgi:hypothetical protein
METENTPARLRIRIVFDEGGMIGPGKADLLVFSFTVLLSVYSVNRRFPVHLR